ncbi:sugar kinase [Amaricoccus sp.]|uniref:sugar kinase n=1 Tax=Amaricoccus sp. TaxID=1872485 RepID=UPI001B4C0B7D|nr:sugar kinase [Amaricoccus sp.]MBP7242429.1 sugar kinase [Amaricoccus sp.]
MTGRIVCLGECMVEFAPNGDGLYRRGFAGDTFNTAWYLRRLLPAGRPVDYVSCVGTDAVSDAMLAFMADAGVGTGGVARLPDRTVGLYVIDVKDGERSFSYWRSASAARLLAADPARLGAALDGAALVLLSGITLAIVPDEDRPALLAALAAARKAGATIAFDPNIRPRLWGDAATMRAALDRAAAGADVVLPSFEDEATHFGDADPDATLARFRAAGAATVIVKNGPGEVVAWDAHEGRTTFRPSPVEARDTTAAGDSFNAGFLAARLAGAPLAAAIEAGATLAGRVCQHPGALVPI